MAFKNTFLRLRKGRGWTQQRLVDPTSLWVGQVKKYEKGDSAPTLHILGHIAMAYGVSTDELVSDGRKGAAATTLALKLLGRFEKVALLPDEERNAALLDSVIAKHTIRKLMGP